MRPSIPPAILEALVRVCTRTHGLALLLLFGSRGRGEARAGSDWDFGYLFTGSLDVAGLMADIVEIVGSDRIDLADLSRASGLLRFRAARDGLVIYEARAHLAEGFRLEAAQFWCDAAPVLQQGYDQLLAELDP